MWCRLNSVHIANSSVHRFLFILKTKADKISGDSLFQRAFPWRFTAWNLQARMKMGWNLKKLGQLNTIPAKVTYQLFLFRSFVPLILSKEVKGQWIILKTHSCSSSYIIRGISKGVFEWCNVNQKWAFSLLICLEAAKFVLLSVFTLIETICLKICKLVPRVFSFSKPRSPWGRDRTKGLFTWSGGPQSSGVGFFCFHALGDTKQKKLTPLDRGSPLHVNRV